MENTRALALDKATTATMTKFIALTAVASLAPFFIHDQMITGPIINAAFIVAVVMIGLQNTLLLILLPSTVALSRGLLPAVLAPMIPFIMISNAVLVVFFNTLRQKNYWLGILLGSFLKFLFLWSTSSIVVNMILDKQKAQVAATMMSYPQFFTALAGGVIAFGVLKFLKKV